MQYVNADVGDDGAGDGGFDGVFPHTEGAKGKRSVSQCADTAAPAAHGGGSWGAGLGLEIHARELVRKKQRLNELNPRDGDSPREDRKRYRPDTVGT